METNNNVNNEIDLVFVCDCTSSMSSAIRSAQENIQKIIEMIQAQESRDVRFGLISYRDHPPQDHSYVTQIYPFTKSVTKAKQNVDQMSASGGGDVPEAVGAALHEALNLDYRKTATKIVVICADAPPHGLGRHSTGDGFPEGDPTGQDVIKDVHIMAERGIVIYAVGCGSVATWPFTVEFFKLIARVTGGRYIALENYAILPGIIIGGTQEEVSLQKVAEQVEIETQKVEADFKAKGEELDDKKVSEQVASNLAASGVSTETLFVDPVSGSSEQDSKTEQLIDKLVNCKTLPEVRAYLDLEPAPPYKPSVSFFSFAGSSGLFGSLLTESPSTHSSSAGLFGSATESHTSGGLFGSSPSMFDSAHSTAPTSSAGLFGATTAPPFHLGTASPSPASGGLFGSTSPAFGSSTSHPTFATPSPFFSGTSNSNTAPQSFSSMASPISAEQVSRIHTKSKSRK